jgi:hypothetical protein
MSVKTDIQIMTEKTYLIDAEKELLFKSLKKINLLTPDFANTKTAKSAKEFSGYVSYILHLSPADIAFKALSRKGTLCPMASEGCKAACLNSAGRGRFTSIQESRLRKSLYFILFKNEFMSHLEKEIAKLEKKATKNGKRLVLRLNGTSDIVWESIKLADGRNIMERFDMVQFYDYTKIIARLEKKQLPSNYYVIFSASESNDSNWAKALTLGYNVAMVFNEIPTQYKTHNVINGDLHDFRFKDNQRGVIVGLKAKGKAKKDTSGFVKQVYQCGMAA